MGGYTGGGGVTAKGIGSLPFKTTGGGGMGLGALGIGAILGGASSLLQGIMGAVQASRGAKGFKRTMANMPKYEIPKEYQDILAKYQQAYAGNMPGYEQTLSNVGQAGSRARGAAERGAISSSAYGAQVGDIYQKELDALQNLGIQQEQYKTNMLGNVAAAQTAMGAQKEQQFNVNQYIPWQTAMNYYGEKQKVGTENLMAGIQGGVSNISDLAGTMYYANALKGLYPQGGALGGGNKATSLYPYGNLLDPTKPLR